MESWFTEPKIPLGRWVKIGITWLQDNAAGFFDAVTALIDFLVDGFTAILLHIPFLVVVFALAALAYWMHRSWRLAAFVVIAFIAIANLGYWQATVETISLVGFATIVSVLIGVPLGIASAHRPWLYALLRPVLDLMQTLPTFVYLIPTLVLFHLGSAPGLISTVIFSIAAPVRLTYLGIVSAPTAAEGSGRGVRRDKEPIAVEGGIALRAADHHGRHHPVHHAELVDGRHRGSRWRGRAWRAGGARVGNGQHSRWASRLACRSYSWRSCSIASSATPSEKEARKMSAVVFDNVDIVFGDKQAEALSMVDRGATRDEILKSTGVVLGAAGVTLSIEPSEICVLMGLSGSGKSTILRAVNGLNKVARGKVLVRHGDGADRRRSLQRRRT